VSGKVSLRARLPDALLWLSVALYVSCLPFNAICTNGSCQDWPAWGILAFGWLALTSTLANVAWLANPTLFVGWLLTVAGAKRGALIFAILAALFVLLPLVSNMVVTNEGGAPTMLDGFAAGYWLWVGAAITNLLASLTQTFSTRSALKET
jgi:hypothetical protein